MTIKFRAWDKILKKITHDISLYVRKDDWINVLSAFDILNERYEFTQFTGLYDKNGEEIFEGDIIKCWSEGKQAIGEVKKRVDGLWIIYPAWQKETSWGLCPSEKGKTTVEVIGNVYENYDLLEEKMNSNNIFVLLQAWGKERGLDTADPNRQMLKLFEEVGELAEGMAKGRQEQIEDSVGDIVVVLNNLCMQLGVSLLDCIWSAYEEIKDRKGKMINGVFVKEEDLKCPTNNE